MAKWRVLLSKILYLAPNIDINWQPPRAILWDAVYDLSYAFVLWFVLWFLQKGAEKGARKTNQGRLETNRGRFWGRFHRTFAILSVLSYGLSHGKTGLICLKTSPKTSPKTSTAFGTFAGRFRGRLGRLGRVYGLSYGLYQGTQFVGKQERILAVIKSLHYCTIFSILLY